MTDLDGFVAPGFEKVRDVVASLATPFGRGGGGVAAYIDGELVVDLWGGVAGTRESWQKNTLACVASVTKSWAAVVVAQLFEEGLLDYTTPMVQWWPEFGQQGKDRITLHEIFMHSNGVLGFDRQVDFLYANDKQGWLDLDGIAERLAAAKPAWAPGSNHGYHAVSYGWLLNEVVRRVTGGRTIGQLFSERIAVPLGLDSYIGTPAAEQDRVARVLVPDLAAAPLLMRTLLQATKKNGSNPESLVGKAFLGDGTTTILDRIESDVASPNFLSAEIPASNGCTTARSLAKLYMALAAGGTLDGVQVLKPETIDELCAVRETTGDAVMTSTVPWFLRRVLPPVRRTYGLSPNPVIRKKTQAGPNPAAFVGMGYGGQLAMGDRQRGLSFASTCSDFTPGLDKKLQPAAIQALYDCLR